MRFLSSQSSLLVAYGSCGSYGYSFLLLEAGNLTGSDHSGSCSSHMLDFAADRILKIKSIEWVWLVDKVDFYRNWVRSLVMLVTHWLTNWLTAVNLIDVTLRCEYGNSKLVEVFTVADVDAEDHVGNSLLIWELTFGHKAELLFRLWAKGLVKI